MFDDERRNAFILSPGAIQDEIETARDQIKQLDRDIAFSTVATAFKQTWRIYVDEFETFYRTHKGWWSNWWYANYEKAIEFRQRTDDWRNQFVKLGGIPSAPPDRLPGSTTDQLLSIGKLALTLGAVALGVKLIAELRKATTTTQTHEHLRAEPINVRPARS